MTAKLIVWFTEFRFEPSAALCRRRRSSFLGDGCCTGELLFDAMRRFFNGNCSLVLKHILTGIIASQSWFDRKPVIASIASESSNEKLDHGLYVGDIVL